MSSSRDPIAIVGIGCRFPRAAGPAAFWRLLEDGVDAVGEIPQDRFDLDRLYDPEPATPGKVSTRWGGFLDGIDRFDADFFGLSPRIAERLDPQQRLLLENSWEALEDAGLAPERLAETRTGVFVGMWINEYEARLFRDPRAIDFHMTVGTGRYAASGRLSYLFGFQGPSLTVDTGCSASLVAVHLACRSLWAGESTLALAAGANVIVEPNITIAYSQSRMMAADGRCKFGDARADGYVRSEGAGVVVLKPLARALADGDRVYATILGSAVNNDGRSSGSMSTPGSAGQEEMLRLAYRDAGVSPGRAAYVEAHGTGTRAGDPVEIGALGAVLADGRVPGDTCRLGSVKTNIGHTEGAAGVAGLIKVALALQHRTIPPSLHFTEPNPDIAWDSLPVRIQRQLEPWPAGAAPAIAGISSFGIAGTNAHVVLQEAPPALAAAPVRAGQAPRILPISARSERALDESIRRMQAFLAGEAAAQVELDDLCWTASARRGHHQYRLAVVAGGRDELLAGLDATVAGDAAPGVFRGHAESERPRRTVFVFPGQGSQWTGMGRQLLASEPAFRDALEVCDRAVLAEAGWSVIEQLLADQATSRMREIDVIQPVLFAIEVALAAVWRARGFEPAAVVGHSMGEVAAACVAGALSVEQAAAIICRRSRLLRRTSGKGAMAVVELPMAEAQEALRGREHLLAVAVSNSSRSTVISGDPAALDALIAELEPREVFCRRVKVDVASHSPQMDPLRPDLLAALDGLQPAPGQVPFYSTVSGELTSGTVLDSEYWAGNLRSPVLFSIAVQRLIADGHHTFIEMSPHPILIPAVEEGIRDSGQDDLLAVPSLRRDEDEPQALLNALAMLYVAGHPIVWAHLYAAPGRHVDLPTYPWQRERHWFETISQMDLAAGDGARSRSAASNHPFLRQSVDVADRPGSRMWELTLDGHAPGYLRDHRVGGAGLVPASVYIELLLAVASDLGLTGAITITGLTFDRRLRVPDGDGRTAVQIIAVPEGPGRAAVRVFGRVDGEWHLHVGGRVESGAAAGDAAARAAGQPSGRVLDRDGIYEALHRAGIEIGSSLQTITSGWREGNCAGGDLTLPASKAHELTQYRAHPALIDGALQLAALGPSTSGVADQFVEPISIDRVTLRGCFEPVMRANVVFELIPGRAGVGADVTVATAAGEVALEICGLRLGPVGDAAGRTRRPDDHLFQLAWQPAPDVAPAPSPSRAVSLDGTWLIVDEAGAIGAPLAERLRQHGAAPRLLAAPALAGVLAQQRPPDLAGILYIAPGAAPAVAAGREDHPSPADRAMLISEQLVDFFKTLPDDVPAWLVTAGAQSVRDEEPVALALAPVWGLGRTFSEEHPERWGGLIDVSAQDTPSEAAAAVVCALSSRDGDDQVAVRDGVRHLLRLSKAAPAAGQGPGLYPDASYLIAGGLGDLGLQVARWMVQQGARRLILMGRTPLPPRRDWTSPQPAAVAGRIAAIRSLEASGATVHVVALDVADRSALSAYLATFAAERWPPIRGVVQCAGVIEGRLLDQLDAASLDRVLRPKVAGTWNLHELTVTAPLDFFVLFSSMAALLPSPGQGSYAAGNAFLDALAHERHALGLPALSINWGPWTEIGMAAALADNSSRLASSGIGPIAPNDAAAALSHAVRQASPQIAIMSFELPAVGKGAPTLPAVLGTLVQASPAAEGRAASNGAGDLRQSIEAAPSFEARRSILETALQEQIGAVLKRPAARIELTKPLRTMGLESLLALELRNRLEALTSTRLPATLAWNYPTVTLLAPFLAAKMGIDLVEPAAPVLASAAAALAGIGERDDLSDLLDELDGISDAEARRLMGEGL